MPFHSMFYLFFLIAVFVLYYSIHHKHRWIVLLLGSLFFYAFLRKWELIVILVYVIGVTYYGGLIIEKYSNHGRINTILMGLVLAILLPLLMVKYPAILLKALQGRVMIETLASIGVSFYTFQALSYLFDVKLEKIRAENNLGYLALYLSFFPKMLQGPIERADSLLPQLKQNYQFDYQMARRGMLIFGVGLFKKLVIADRLAPMANTVFSDVTEYTGISLWMGLFYFALQIYFDFSAYTDMAIGTGRLFGIELAPNFNQPYFATSVPDFWRRWHMSFSRWLMDYLFKPLQMSVRQYGISASVIAAMVTFVICGIWHGSTWNYVMWVAINGVYVAVSISTAKTRKKIHKKLRTNRWPKLIKTWQTVFTFALICFAWIFFRAESLGDAVYICTHLFDNIFNQFRSLFQKPFLRKFIFMGRAITPTALFLIAMMLMIVIEYRLNFLKNYRIFQSPTWIRWSFYCLFALIFYFNRAKSIAEFIYFQF